MLPIRASIMPYVEGSGRGEGEDWHFWRTIFAEFPFSLIVRYDCHIRPLLVSYIFGKGGWGANLVQTCLLTHHLTLLPTPASPSRLGGCQSKPPPQIRSYPLARLMRVGRRVSAPRGMLAALLPTAGFDAWRSHVTYYTLVVGKR